MEALTIVLLAASFAFVLASVAWLGAGSTDMFGSLFVAKPDPERPRGVQEPDLPPFRFHAA